MKNYLKFLIVLLVACSGCSKDDNSSGIPVGEELEMTLQTQYPGARKIFWERKNTYIVATFQLNGEKMSAWYDPDGYWYMTEKQIKYYDLPVRITNTYNTDNTSRSASISSVTSIERSVVEPIYVISLDTGAEEIDNFYSEDGILVKSQEQSYRIYGDFRYEIAPKVNTALLNFINTNYSDARIMEVDIMFPGIVLITFIHNDTVKISEFSVYGSWNSTKWVVDSNYVNDNHPKVAAYFAEQGYPGDYKIISIEFIQLYDTEHYTYTLRYNGEEIQVHIHLYEVN